MLHVLKLISTWPKLLSLPRGTSFSICEDSEVEATASTEEGAAEGKSCFIWVRGMTINNKDRIGRIAGIHIYIYLSLYIYMYI